MVSRDSAIRYTEPGCESAVRRRVIARMRAVLTVAMTAAFALTSMAAYGATIVVNSRADPGAAGICALRDAITAANTMIMTNGCAAGTGNDTIEFSITGIIALASTLPQVTDPLLTINGPPSPGITIDGGGAVRVMRIASGATINLNKLTIAHGFSRFGGGIGNAGTLTVTNSTFTGNVALHAQNEFGGIGGGIENGGTLTITNSRFFRNSAVDGGGIVNFRSLTVIHSVFSHNRGIAIWNFDRATLTVVNSVFSANSAFVGAGIANNPTGNVSVSGSTFSANKAIGSEGGGIDNEGTLTVTNSTFSRNYALGGGGAMGNDFGGALTVVNSTFSGNSSGCCGGGLQNFFGSTLTVTNSTFSTNSAGSDGGAISNLESVASFKGTILAASGSGGNCNGTITDAGYNISDDNSCGLSATGSLTNTNPGLFSDGLVNNGGPTQTIALMPGSPAIDAIPLADCMGQASPPNRIITDQRGALRPDVGEVQCDVGAYEFQDLAGQRLCGVRSVFVLTRQFGSIKAAASALGFRNVRALRKAIAVSCGG